jgi:RES domain-containing protein
MSGMAEFPTVYGYWNFERSVKRKARYVHDDDVREFLKTVMETSELRRKTLEEGQILCRAQRGFKWRRIEQDDEEFEVEGAYPADRMVPRAEFVGEGRVNSRGIPCLYLASNQKTAMSEVRPWVGSYISLAQFKVTRDCDVVDCSMDKKRSSFVFTSTGELKEPDAAGREAGVWGDIAQAFSKPITVDEPHSDYVPTQVLAEAFRSHGYDGILYKSLLDDGGFNIALFDLASAELINCGLYQTKSVLFEFEPADNPYFVLKHYPEITLPGAKPEKQAPTE